VLIAYHKETSGIPPGRGRKNFTLSLVWELLSSLHPEEEDKLPVHKALHIVIMSGRLVILPHKSWNVWNQDNREKVMRDERLHREAEEAKVEKEKKLLQEQNLELLRATNGIDDKTSDAADAEVVPFRLFEDLERKHFDKLGNEEYLKEKAAKELTQKKRDGIADWALGEGSYENSKSKPWFADLGSSSSSSAAALADVAKSAALQREQLRKGRADPMGSILVPNKHDYQPKSMTKVPKVLPECAPLEAIESKEDDDNYDTEEHHRDSRKRKHKSDKRDRSGSRERKHSHKKHSKSRRSEDRDRKHKTDQDSQQERAGRHDTGSSNHISSSNSSDAVPDKWADLRRKRLEREAVERKRAAVLLAEADIYGGGARGGAGGGGRGSSSGYSQQYNPHLARNGR
jgi:hypothetical protein